VTGISIVLEHSPVLYAALSAVNMLMILCFSALGAYAVFRATPRRHRALYAAAVALALAAGSLRPWAFSTSLQAVRGWNLAVTLLPFVCAAYPAAVLPLR